MARLIGSSVPMSMAVWLTVTLVVIVGATYSTSFSLHFTKTEDLEKRLPNLSDKELHKLGRRYVGKLHKKSDSIGYDEVNNTLTKLYGLHKNHVAFNLHGVGLANPWKKLVLLQQSRDNCGRDINAVSDFVSTANENEHRRQFALECFEDYLKKCGYEDRFKKIVDSMKHKSDQHLDSYTFPTFNGYLKTEFWPRESSGDSAKQDLDMLLLAVKELPALGSISSGNDCTNMMTTNFLFRRANFGACRKFFDDYLPLYLNACGFEERFKKLVDNIEQPTEKSRFSEAYPTLNTYLAKKFPLKATNYLEPLRKELVNLFSVMDNLNNIANCNEESKDKLIESITNDYQSPKELEQIYFAQYLENCGFEQKFKKAIDRSKQTLPEPWNSVAYPTFYSFFKRTSWKQNQIKQALSYIENFSTMENISAETECTDKLRDNLIHGLADKDKYLELRNLTNVNFALYLDKCGFERIFKRVVDYSKQMLNESWNLDKYPTFNSYISRPWQESWLKQVLLAVKDFAKLEAISKEAGCTEMIENNLATKLADSDRYPELRKLTNVNFALYLKKCGLEQTFKKLIDHSKQIVPEPWNSVKYPTFYSFSKRKSWTQPQIKRALSYIRDYNTLENISEQKDCSENLEDKLLKGVADGDNHLELQNFTKTNFAIYLDKCGFEQIFKEIVDHSHGKSDKFWSPVKYPTLYSVYAQRFWKQPQLKLMLALIKDFPTLKDISTETDCTEKYEYNIVDALDKSADCLELQKLANNNFPLYLVKCGLERGFKKAVDHFKKTPGKSWELAAYPTFDKYLSQSWWTPYLRQTLKAMRDYSSVENISKETDCTEKLEDSLLNGLFANKKYPELKMLSDVSFAVYIERCREPNFKKLINQSKQTSGDSWDSVKYPTLYTYITKEVWELPQWLKWLLSAVRDYSNVENISAKTDCTKQLEIKMLSGIAYSNSYPELQTIIKSLFASYSDKCGLEERFAKVKAQHKVFANEIDLSSYMFDNFHADKKRVLETDLLHVLTVVKKLADFGQFDKSTCKDETIDFIEELRTNYTIAFDCPLKRDLNAMLGDYFGLCKDKFKTAAEKFKHDHKEEWAFIERAANYMISILPFQFDQDQAKEFASTIIPSAAMEIYKGNTKDFRTKLQADCKVLLDYMDRDLTTMSYDWSVVKNDEQVMGFMKYLSCCSRVIFSSDSKPSPFKSMFEKIGTPFYPEKIVYKPMYTGSSYSSSYTSSSSSSSSGSSDTGRSALSTAGGSGIFF